MTVSQAISGCVFEARAQTIFVLFLKTLDYVLDSKCINHAILNAEPYLDLSSPDGGDVRTGARERGIENAIVTVGCCIVSRRWVDALQGY